jgi:hypothetical protein
MNSKWLVAAVCLLTPVSTLAQTPPYGGNFCGFRITASNSERHVYGIVEAECTYACPLQDDSHPFGNWGVDSFYGARNNGTQYGGWSSFNRYCNEQMAPPEWNSCTSDLSLRGDSQYYNEQDGTGAYTRQHSAFESQYGESYLWLETNEDQGCSRFDGTMFSFGGDYLDIYELDPGIFCSGCRDDYVTTLSVPGSDTILSCVVDSCAPFESDWILASNSITSALFKYRGTMDCFWVDGKGCH